MPSSDVASLVGGAALGAPFSEIFKLVIEEAKKVIDFKAMSEDLASSMESLVPVVNEIDSMQEGSDPRKGELKLLFKIMERVAVMVGKCSRVPWYDVVKKSSYTREIKGINQDLFKFCQIQVQIIQLRNQMHTMRPAASVSTTIQLSSDTENEFEEVFLVPQPESVTIYWLDRALLGLKKLLFEDTVPTVVVSASSPCGKTTLVTKLCYDADVKARFKQIFFITLSKAPNLRLIIQTLVEDTGCKANEIANNSDERLCIQQMLNQLTQRGSLLLVLDDVWPEDESLLHNLFIQLPGYKILVTSRFEFPRFGPTYHLEPLIDEVVKTLFIEVAPQPNHPACTTCDHLRQMIHNRCNGSALAMIPPCSTCEGCNSAAEHERFVNVLGVLWHPECFCCDACGKPIAIHEKRKHVSNSRGKFHKSCYRELIRPNCYICKQKLPLTEQGIIYTDHPFWKEKYCPSHEGDGTARCCSCERLEPRGTNYTMLGDGRWLCLQCMESSVMDYAESQPLLFEMLEFFEGLGMKIEKECPLFMVECQALNERQNRESIGYQYETVTRSKVLSEKQTITIARRTPGQQIQSSGMGMDTETEKCIISNIDIIGILIVYGLPRLLTGYILAHSMMHAWLRLNDYQLDMVLEEGICQTLAYTWLESQTYATPDAMASAAAEAASSSSRTPPPAATTSKQGDKSDFEKRFTEFCKCQIETDDSPVYGLGFKKVYKMMVSNHHNIKNTLNEIVLASKTTHQLQIFE